MRLLALHHVQLAMPPGREDEARAFYAGLLGLPEREKPDGLRARGGCWFEGGGVRVHLGVEPGFAPARKAHPAVLVDDLAGLAARLAGLAARLAGAGHPCRSDQPLAGFDRLYVDDPFGNRIELMQAKA